MIQSFVWCDAEDSRVVNVRQHTNMADAYEECAKYRGDYCKVVTRDEREAGLVWNLIGATCRIPERRDT